ncbi:MAG: hypothetical protein IPG79_17815 [Saprospiraceae bacterium]|nr:hypothetical protein [Saprospiraceae bacterium]
MPRGKTENEIFLYSQVDDNEYKFPLSIDNGLLQLKDENPFFESIEIVNEDWSVYQLIGLKQNRKDLKTLLILFPDNKPG